MGLKEVEQLREAAGKATAALCMAEGVLREATTVLAEAGASA